VEQILHPTKEIDDEKDQEYRSETDVHKNLRWMVRVLISTQVSAHVGTLPYPTLPYIEKPLEQRVMAREAERLELCKSIQ
jgi:hypothetical protein